MSLKQLGLTIFVTASFSLAAAEGEIREVTAEGRGATRMEAMNAAYQDAIAKQVGVIVKERTELDNDAVKSKILTLSNGYIVEPPPDSAVIETKVNGGVHILLKGVKVYVEKMKKRMIGIYTATLPLSDIRKTPEKYGYRKFTDAYTRMLIDEIDDYSRIFQIQPVNKVLTTDRKGNPVLIVNFMLAVNPADYKNYTESLYANLVRMNFEAGKNQRAAKKKFIVEYSPIPSARRKLLLATNMANIDPEILREHYIGANKSRRQMICRMELLDKNGEILQKKLFYNPQLNPIVYSPTSARLALVLPKKQALNQELHTSFEFTIPEDVAKVSSVRLTLHYDFPDNETERESLLNARGFFEQK